MEDSRRRSRRERSISDERRSRHDDRTSERRRRRRSDSRRRSSRKSKSPSLRHDIPYVMEDSRRRSRRERSISDERRSRHDDRTSERRRRRRSDSRRRSSRKSKSPSPKVKERKKRSKWDMPAAAGGDGSGPFGLLGATGLGSLSQNPIEDRRGRRLYVGNLPGGATESAIVQFFNGALLAAAGVDYSVAATAGQFPVIKAEVGPRRADASGQTDHRYCFLEFRTIADANICLKLDGINFNGFMLKIGRPNDYAAFPPPTEKSTGEALAEALEKTRLTEAVKMRELKMFVQEVPQSLTDEGLRALAERFGTVKSAALAKDIRTGASMGYGVVVYENEEDLDRAVAALDKKPMERCIPRFTKKPLVISKLDSVDPTQVATAEDGSLLGGATATSSIVTELPTSMTYKVLSDAVIGAQVAAARTEGSKPSRVVQLLNTVFPEDLVKDEEFEAFKKDVIAEASQYGKLADCVIPRPPADLSYREGVGKVFLRYDDVTAARKAQWELNGRTYEERRVICAAFFPEELFEQGRYTLMI